MPIQACAIIGTCFFFFESRSFHAFFTIYLIARCISRVPSFVINNEDVADTFSISIKKILSGEDAQFLLNGIGGTLLKNQKYTVEIKIKEK